MSKRREMKVVTILLIAALLGCQSSTETTTTEIEGTWGGICIVGFFNTSSSKVISVFEGNNATFFVNNYDDSNCSNLISTTPASQSSLFANPSDIPVSFNIGNRITSANGISVKEINFIKENNEVVPDIFLLQDNGNTLYFGVPCMFSSSPCVNNRPVEIDFNSPNVKIN